MALESDLLLKKIIFYNVFIIIHVFAVSKQNFTSK